jgi:general stress protein YciG
LATSGRRPGLLKEPEMLNAEENVTTLSRAKRGFAAMDPSRQKEIASLGGKAAHQSGHAHEFTSDEARAAGRKRHQLKSNARPAA